MSDPALDRRSEVERLRDRVNELESTIQAIRSGEVDALVTASPEGERVFTLRAADQPYRILVETMGEGAAMIDTDGLILYCNLRFAEMVGKTPDRVIGRMLQEFIGNDQPATCSDLLTNGARGEWHCESVMRRASGQQFPVLLSANRAEMVGSVSICLVATDITVRREYESIVEAERLANSILEQALEAIVVCNAEGRIIRSNGAAARLCPAAVPGAIFDAAVGLLAVDGSAIRAASVVAGQIIQGLEARAAGIPVLVNASPLPEGAGAVVTLTDISQRKEFEESLKRKSEDLIRSNADLERFAFLASHDLQEPLRMVNAYAQLLTRRYREAGGAEVEVFAGYIETGVRA